MVFGLLGGATMLVVVITVGSTSAPGLIDDPDLISVIERECEQMTNSVEALPMHGTPRRQAQTIARQNVAVEDMVDDIRSVGSETLASDPPTNEWLADWDRLIDARESYATKILDGSFAQLDVPNDDRGNDIDLRMDDVFIGSSACEVPEALLNPYPDDEASDA